MKIKSARVRTYRVHRDTSIEFDPKLTLITGPNESGKSTLVEAMHRALFLRSKTGGEPFEQMKSKFGDFPRIDLELDFSGNSCHVSKSFRGGKGDTNVELGGMPALTGDAADEKLAELLRVSGPVDGRGAASQLPTCWAHLWVWQGKSGESPAGLDNVAGQHEALVRRLQTQGAAGAVQSDLDSAVCKAIKERKAALYTEPGKAKANTDEARISADVETLAVAFRLAAEKVAELDGASQRLIAVRAEMRLKEEALAQAVKDCRASHQKLDAANILQGELGKLDEEIKAVTRELATLLEMADELSEAREQVRKTQKAVVTGAGALGVRKLEAEGCRETLNKTEVALNEARTEAERGATRGRALAEQATALDRKRRLDELQQKAKAIEKARTERASLQAELDALPAVEDDDIEELQEFQQALGRAEATLAALGATLDVISCKQSVTVNGKAVKAGDRQIITSDTEITVGAGTQLMLRPGGETGIAEARDAVAEAKDSLQEKLRALGVMTLAAATKVKKDRDLLSGRISTRDETLARLDAEACEEELPGLHADYMKARSRAQTIATEIGLTLPQAAPELKRATEEADRVESETSEKLRTCQARAAVTRSRYEAACRELEEENERQTVLKTQHDQVVIRVKVLEEQYGSDDARAGKTAALSESRGQDEIRRNQRAGEFEALQPDLCRQNVERFTRAGESLQNTLNMLREEQVKLQERLRQHGTIDPYADLQEAEARLEKARARQAELVRQGRAIQLLARLADEAQRAVAAKFTQPLADTVKRYLECIFGVGAAANLTLDESRNTFADLECVRDARRGGTFRFEQLSGGAREQVGVAYRLALAELLSKDHGGSLPVVLDDAFANSDPERVRALLGMLDYAAQRGLQVIVLTCSPGDYATLGAREIRLEPPVFQDGAIRDQPTGVLAVPSASVAFDHEPGEVAQTEAPPSAALTVSSGDQQAFLECLAAVGGKSGNMALRLKLEWTDERYQAVREALISVGQVLIGQGRGGSVRLPDP